MSTMPDAPDAQNNTPEPPAWSARASLAVLFLAAIIGWSALNLYTEGPRVADGLSAMAVPNSYGGLRDYFKKGEALVDEYVLGKPEAWDIHSRIETSLGKTAMNNMSVIKGPEGRLFRGGLYSLPVENAAALAVDVATLAELAGERDAWVLSLGTPDTVIKGDANVPAGMPYLDYNVPLDAYLFTLRERGVPFLDSRYSYAAHGFPTDDITSKTGFLLTGESAFALFTYLVDDLRERFLPGLDPDGFHRDRANYTLTTYPDFFIGHMGKETGPAFSGLDDFTTLAPAFDTEFAIDAMDMFGKTTKAVGSAGETLLNPDALIYFDTLYNLYPEGYYVHTNAAWSRIVNPHHPDGPKLLFVHDFYTAPLISLLAPLCGELHTIAYQDNYPINAEEYIQDKDFDGIIISFLPQNLLRPQSRTIILGESATNSR